MSRFNHLLENQYHCEQQLPKKINFENYVNGGKWIALRLGMADGLYARLRIFLVIPFPSENAGGTPPGGSVYSALFTRNECRSRKLFQESRMRSLSPGLE